MGSGVAVWKGDEATPRDCLLKAKKLVFCGQKLTKAYHLPIETVETSES